jgi:hypothetical protein
MYWKMPPAFSPAPCLVQIGREPDGRGSSLTPKSIWAARENGISTLYMEDFQHGREIEGVRIINPLLAPP